VANCNGSVILARVLLLSLLGAGDKIAGGTGPLGSKQ
jgi:hypothetical protein